MPSPDRDPRVYFAAERTFLAWIRTGLALMGFGFVVARFGIFLREIGSVAPAAAASGVGAFRSSSFSIWVGTAIVMIGVIVNLVSAAQHWSTVRDLNAGKGVTGRPSLSGLILAGLLAVVGLSMAGYLAFFR